MPERQPARPLPHPGASGSGRLAVRGIGRARLSCAARQRATRGEGRLTTAFPLLSSQTQKEFPEPPHPPQRLTVASATAAAAEPRAPTPGGETREGEAP